MNIDITEEENRKKLSKPTQNSSDLLLLLFSRILVLSRSQHFPHSLSWLLSPEVLNAMSALANSFISTNSPRIQSSSGSSFKQVDQCLVNMVPCQRKAKILKRPLRVNAGYREDDRSPTTTGIFIGGFLLGGIVIGTLGCIYAPQISKAIAGADRKDLMRKLPKFIYDEEKALEKTRKILTEKIAQLNSAIDDVSSQLRAEDTPNETAVSSDEVEAAI